MIWILLGIQPLFPINPVRSNTISNTTRPICKFYNPSLLKLENLNKRALRIVLDEKALHYQELLSKFNSSDLYSIRCQDMMKTVFKAIQFETMPKYIRGIFQMRNSERNLRGSRKLVIPYVNTTTYGLHSFRYTSANMWNKLTEDLRSLTSLNEFRAKICQISFERQCNCYLCR